MKLPSKKLLSLVYPEKPESDVFVDIQKSSKRIMYFGKEHKDPRSEINIHDAASECKDWAFSKGYSIRTLRTSLGWVIDLFHEDRKKSITSNELREKINGQLIIEIFPRKLPNTIHPAHFKTEPDSVFAACEWILKLKDKQ